MLENYKTIYAGGEGEITEKKSRFIATVRLVEKEEDALAFIEESGITKRHDIHFIYVRRICKYSTNGPDSKTGHCNAQGDQADEKDSDKRNMCPFSHHGRAGNKRIPFLRGRFFSVVHDKPPL